MPESTRYFELRDHVGVTADGNPEPIAEIGVALAVPIMRGGEVVGEQQRHVIAQAPSLKEGMLARVLPGTRLIEASDPRVCDVLLQSELVKEVDPPSKKAEQHQRGEARAAKQEAGTHSDPDNTEEG